MRKKEDSKPTIYSRGRFKIEGNTDADRDFMRQDNRRYWTYMTLMAISSILLALCGVIKALYPLFK